jgi:hypothetical protein
MMTRSKFLVRRLALTCGVATVFAATAAVAAGPSEIVVEGDRIFPGSITSTREGAVIIGSVMTGQFYRAEPGAARAKAWAPVGGSQPIFGILADDRTQTLWACSSPLRLGPPSPTETPPPPSAAVIAYDLRTGTTKSRYPLTVDSCGDIAIGSDGAVYATSGTQVVRLAPGGPAFQAWSSGSARLNAIAFAQGHVFIGVHDGSGLASIEVKPDGSAGQPQEVKLDQPLQGPDGMRAYGANALLVPENQAPGSRLTLVTLTPAGARRTVLKSGFPDGAISVTAVGKVAYVLEGQVAALRNPNAKLNPFHAVAVDLPAQ